MICRRCGDGIVFEAGDWYHICLPDPRSEIHDPRFCGGDDTRDEKIAEPIPAPMTFEG